VAESALEFVTVPLLIYSGNWHLELQVNAGTGIAFAQDMAFNAKDLGGVKEASGPLRLLWNPLTASLVAALFFGRFGVFAEMQEYWLPSLKNGKLDFGDLGMVVSLGASFSF
jgi:hypothetical protein